MNNRNPIRSLLRQIRRRVGVVVGKDFFIKAEIDVPQRRYGSVYGGWHVAADRVSADSVIYSFGVGDDVTFDLALIQEHGLTVHAFDPTPKSLAWVQRQDFPRQFVFHPYGVAGTDGQLAFHPPKNSQHVSYTMLSGASSHDAILAPVKRLATIMKELGHDHVDLLKMDIEGAEYEVIEDMLADDIRPVQVLVEFHHRFPGIGAKKSLASIASLQRAGYRLFHVSDIGEEFSFIHNVE